MGRYINLHVATEHPVSAAHHVGGWRIGVRQHPESHGLSNTITINVTKERDRVA